MPAYQNAPFQIPRLLQDGIPEWLFGSFNGDQSNSMMRISNSALTGNVGVLTVQLYEGPIPVVGGTISIQQTQNGGGALNVNRAVITAVAINAQGAGTISFTFTHANVTSAADTGLAVADIPQIPETLTAVASIPVAIQVSPQMARGQRNYATTVTFPTMPTAATVVLQAAVRNVDAEYMTSRINSSRASTVRSADS